MQLNLSFAAVISHDNKQTYRSFQTTGKKYLKRCTERQQGKQIIWGQLGRGYIKQQASRTRHKQPGSVRAINHLKPFVHLPGRGQLSMYNKACYRSFDLLVLLLRKFDREKNDLDALVDGAAPVLSRSLSELVALKLLVVD